MSVKNIVYVLLVAAMLAASTTQAQQPPDWVDPPGLERAIEIQDRYTPALMARDGVEGTAVGYDDSGEVAIKVYAARAGVPGIPQAIEQVPVQVVVTGRFVARADPTARFVRPVPIGVSTGHPDITAGTIGCRVKDAAGYVYALSNNHVYANANDANIGDSVLQPGSFDGGQDPADFIGNLHDYESINFSGADNYIDAAIASSSTSYVGYATPSGDGYGTPNSTIVSAFVGQNVQKYGRTTGWTQGQVAEVNVTLDVCYQTQGPLRCRKQARFVDQIAITPGSFSAGGDSGSLIVTDDSNRHPVGLLFAGSSTRTIANEIQTVLDRFNVTIDDGSGGGGPTNFPPTAGFTYTTTDLTVDFTDQSTDSDGSVVGRSWDFGDGNTSTAQNPSHTYGSDGTYNVSLMVTDDDSATDTTFQVVTVSASATGGIALSATGYKVKGLQKADLEWTGASGTNVDVYRDAAPTPLPNDGSYTDNIDQRGGGSYIYQVCEAGTSTCSADATVTF
jgi:PKD repeat protein